MNEREYLKLRKKFDDDYAERVRSLELIWREANGSTPPKLVKVAAERKTAGKRKDAKVSSPLAASIEQAVATLPADFNTIDVIRALERQNPEKVQLDRTAITHTLKRMAAARRLFTITAPGRGRQPTTYAKVEESTE